MEFNKVLNKIQTKQPGGFAIDEYLDFKDRYYDA